MVEQPSPDDAMFARFFSGESDAPERAYVERWIAADPSRGPLAKHLRTIWGRAVDADQAFDLPGIWRRLAHELSPGADRRALSVRTALAPHTGPQGVGGGGRADRVRWIVAALVVVIAIGTVSWRTVTVPSAPQVVREFATPAGSRSIVTLRDGTRLVLGPATRLRVPADFARHRRTVELEGEAYFAVVHDDRRPFAVRAGNAIVTDVGTEFAVQAYGGDPAVRVAVAGGQVCLGPTSRCNRPLRVGDVATIGATGLAIAHNANVAALTAWTQGRLVFDGMPLRDVVRELGRAFDVQITIADSTLATYQVSGAFDNETLDQVLDDITDVMGGRYERVGRTVVIHRGAAKATRRPPPSRPPLSTAQATAPSR